MRGPERVTAAGAISSSFVFVFAGSASSCFLHQLRLGAQAGKPSTGSSPAARPTIPQTQTRNEAARDNEPVRAPARARRHWEAATRPLPAVLTAKSPATIPPTPPSLRSVQRPGKFSGTPERNAITSNATLTGYLGEPRRGAFSSAIDVAALIRLPPQDQKSCVMRLESTTNAALCMMVHRV